MGLYDINQFCLERNNTEGLFHALLVLYVSEDHQNNVIFAMFCELFTLLCLSGASSSLQWERVFQYHPVVLKCPGETDQHNYWHFMGNAIFYNRIPVTEEFKAQYDVFKNYSLLIRSASLRDEGTYTCILGTNVVVTYYVEVKGQLKFGH